MNILERIVNWQKSRGLIKNPKNFNVNVESLNLLEEIIELNYNLKSKQAREIAILLEEVIQDKLKYDHEIFDPNTSDNQKIDALCDLIVYATGAIRKLGYNPKHAMDETLKEIESRQGKIIKGKFEKNESPEAQAKWYKANYDIALIKR